MLSSLVVAAGSPGAYYAYEQSDAMGQGVVILLLIGSVFTWSVMVDKGWALYKARKLSRSFLDRFHESKREVTSLLAATRDDPAPVARVYQAGAAKLAEFYRNAEAASGAIPAVGGQRSPAPPVKLTDAQNGAIEAVLEREVSSQVMELESGMSFLATIVSVSPFFGLFGTVWGVMLSFCAIAVEGKADISAMAPGISGALLTTVVGLLVAIPSLIGYNLLTGTIRKITVYMDNFTEEFLVETKLEQLNKDSE